MRSGLKPVRVNLFASFLCLNIKIKLHLAGSFAIIQYDMVCILQVSLSESEDSQDSSDSIGSSQKARGILARRPSYRSVLYTKVIFRYELQHRLYGKFEFGFQANNRAVKKISLSKNESLKYRYLGYILRRHK